MPPTTCPLPAVQEALSPYIHDRSETLRIRQQIDQHLFAQVESNDEDTTHLTRALHSKSAALREIPSSIKGVRRAYIRALQSHVAAQKRLEELRSELEELRNGLAPTDDNQADFKKARSMKNYIALLRLRQRLNRLKVLQSHLKLLTGEADGMELGLRELVRKAIGDHPEAPSPLLGDGSEDIDSDELIMELKKAVLTAKYDMDQARKDGTRQDDAATKSNLSGKVLALRHARDELVGWIEEQLAKVPDEPSMYESYTTNLEANESASRNVDFSDIEDQYENYIVSRESLVRFIESTHNASTALLSPTSPTKRNLLSRQSPKSSVPSPTNATKQSTNVPKEPSKAVTLLPYIGGLSNPPRTSQALLSQTAFLRRQLGSADEDRRATLERLAQESHLLHAGNGAQVSAWNQAATGASKELREFVEQKVTIGERALAQGSDALNEIDEDRKAVESLQG